MCRFSLSRRLQYLVTPASINIIGHVQPRKKKFPRNRKTEPSHLHIHIRPDPNPPATSSFPPACKSLSQPVDCHHEPTYTTSAWPGASCANASPNVPPTLRRPVDPLPQTPAIAADSRNNSPETSPSIYLPFRPIWARASLVVMPLTCTQIGVVPAADWP